jgi:ribulose-5-phosphate 4-epimerase/fuculose-1-phosphate aldolase
MDAASAAKATDRLNDPEHLLREDLAACYRLIHHFGWDDLVFNHITMRVPGPDHHFFINPFGLTFDEIRASDMIKLDLDGNPVEPTNHKINKAGFVIHSAIHMAREDAKCVMHLHTNDGVAVSALEEGLLPLNQTAMVVAHDLAYHEFEGPAVTLDERERLAADLGDKNLMLLRNHGTLAVGRTPAECFSRMYFLERACTYQYRTLAMGRQLHFAPDAAVDTMTTMSKQNAGSSKFYDETVWPAMKRLLDRKDPSYRL